jgi:hypothetical protein
MLSAVVDKVTADFSAAMDADGGLRDSAMKAFANVLKRCFDDDAAVDHDDGARDLKRRVSSRD